MNNRQIAPVLALDIGNVAIHIDPIPLLNHIGFDSMDAFHAYDADKAIWNGCMAFENGKMSVDEFSNWLSSVVPAPIAAKDIPWAWGSLLGDEIQGIAEVVRYAVDNGIKPVFMSDICSIRYKSCRDFLSFTNLMQGAVLSYEVGHHKPHEAMYIEMETVFCDGGVPLLYVDDLLPNVEAGAQRGWETYQFGTATELLARLKRRIGDVL